MEHCTGGSKEIKFNNKTEKQQTPAAAWKWAVGVIIIIREIAEFAGPTGISGLQ